MSREKELEFCEKYDAQVTASDKKFRRLSRSALDIIWAKTDADNVDFSKFIETNDVECVNICMPKDRFEALIEHNDWIRKAGLQDNNYFQNTVMRVSVIAIEHEKECLIRQENPAVKSAYEKYKSLLKLVKSYYD